MTEEKRERTFGEEVVLEYHQPLKERKLEYTRLLPERMLPWAEGLWLKHGASGLAAALKGLRFRVSGTGGISRAQVCGGGVLTGGISSRTMESAACPGLFVTGEMLDVTGICGGWNLGFAFRTGILAGRAAARQVLKSL